jgi:hypothetical protein
MNKQLANEKDYDSSLKDMEAWLRLQSNSVQKNVTVVSSEEEGLEFQIHIDRNSPEMFIPRIGESFGEDENDNVPRVTVAPTILGCIIGYSRCDSDFMTGSAVSKEEAPTDLYRQGYEINRLDYVHALKPTKRMVTHSRRSDEYWLVNYTEKYKEYKPTNIGEFYFMSMTFATKPGPASKDRPAASLTGYLKHTEKNGIYFTDSIKLVPGTYMFTIELDSLYDNEGKKVSQKQTIIPCGKEEYDKNKKLYAALLSDAPSFLKW